MKVCCAVGCSNLASHTFPKDPVRCKRWCIAINRADGNKKLWCPSQSSRLCSAHFISEDFELPPISCADQPRKRLRRGAVPSVFMHRSAPSITSLARNERLRKRKQRVHDATKEKMEKEADIASDTFYDTLSEIQEVEVATEVNDDLLEKGCQTDFTTSSDMDAQTEKDYKSGFGIEAYKYKPESIKYYTGFLDYNHFCYFFSCLGPAATRLRTQSKKLSPEDELFLTLIKLRLDHDHYQLGCLFGISRDSAAKVFKTWLNFMFFQLKELDIWPTKSVIETFMPEDFRAKYPNTRVILDATEIPIERPANIQAQSATWSSYKNKNTLKVIVGISPKGLVTFISDVYGGSTSDRQILERSKIVSSNELFQGNDSIMADRGIQIQDLMASKNVQVNTPTTMKGVNQLPAETVVQDRRIASLRVHVERVIGLAKTYKMLKNVLNSSETTYGDRIIFVCFSLRNFRQNIMPS